MIHCANPCAICVNAGNPDKVVGNDGPDTASTLFLGEGPGFWENRSSKPFVGRAGREFNELYLPTYAQLPRPSVKIANAVSCYYDGANQTPEQARTCAAHNLAPLIQGMPNLRYVVFMGGVACSLLAWAASDAEAGAAVDVPNLFEEHGLPVNGGRDILLFGRRVAAIAVIHPAAGLHQPSVMNDSVDDFQAVFDWRIGGWRGPRDTVGDAVDYYEIDSNTRTMPRLKTVAFDTELDSKRRAWCAQASTQIGRGLMARRGSAGLEEIQELLDAADRVLIHSVKFDWDVAAELGLGVDLEKVTDTMLLAANLFLPQGMKTLARRLCGMKMQSWDDIVGEQFEKDCIGWFQQAELVVGRRSKEWEQQVLGEIEAYAQSLVPEDAKNRRNLVSRERKTLIQQLEDSQLDEWRPPAYYSEDKNGKMGRRRAAGYDKQLGLVLSQHLRSREQGGDGTDFATRWYGDENDDDKPGLIGRLSEWAVKLVHQEVGRFPSKGLDQAPYEQALHYSCRDVDALLRVWPHLERKAKELEETRVAA